MPWRSQSHCTTPGCENLSNGSLCPTCRRRSRARRAAADKPYHDPRWRDTSAAVLRLHPVCEWPDCFRPATQVHHIDGLGPAGPRGYDWSNLQALCAPHHSTHTARDTGFGTRR